MARYYCVIHLERGLEFYTGRSDTKAARVLEPGTVFGYGESPHDARLDAMRRRQEFLHPTSKRTSHV